MTVEISLKSKVKGLRKLKETIGRANDADLFLWGVATLIGTTLIALLVAWALYTGLHAFASDVLISTFGSEELARLFYDKATFVVSGLFTVPVSIIALSLLFMALVDEIRKQKAILKAAWANPSRNPGMIILLMAKAIVKVAWASLSYNPIVLLVLIASVRWIYFGIYLFSVKP